MSSPLILVVDDEEPNRKLLCKILTPLGYRIHEAVDGNQALESIAQEMPDLILLDVMMPKLDGYGVCRQLKDDPKTRLIPVVMLTSLGQLPAKLKGVDLGADEFLTKPFNVLELTTRVRSLLRLKQYTDELESATTVLQSLALVVEHRDGYTGDHCKRLGTYATATGKMLGLDEEALVRLRLGGILHDLGKIAVPDAVLNKPGPLTEAEFELIRKHPVTGDDLARPMRSLAKALPLIRSHHERLDGSGYPDRLKGDEISLEVRIITIADVYDALASARPYKKALPKAECFQILREGVTKKWWDGDVVETLAKILSSPIPV